jgi:GDPmannose 4,6-dehydratase
MSRRALITGLTGQDGSYLAEFLLSKGYDVFGMVRRSSTVNFERITHIQDELNIIQGDLLDEMSLRDVLQRVRPHEVYNLAAQSFVQTSWQQAVLTGETTALGVTRLLNAVRAVDSEIRFYQASSSEMFGKVQEVPQNERTPFYPRSPYGVAKLYAHWITVNYRESHGIYASCGILFNHESPLRGVEFVTRKITLALTRIRQGQQDVLDLGNLDAQRDWGFAGDYVEGMWRMLQQPKANDYVLASGQTHTVREFVSKAADVAGFNLEWQGTGGDEHGVDCRTGKTLVRVNPRFFRPAEVDLLIGDTTKAQKQLGWKPRVSFEELVEMMMKADLKRGSSNADGPAGADK